MSASIPVPDIHSADREKLPNIHEKDKLSKSSNNFQSQLKITNSGDSNNDVKMQLNEEYDPKYGGKSVLEFPSLKRIKHRVSFSGTVVVCLVCYFVYQQFGHAKKSVTNSEAQKDDVIRVNPAKHGIHNVPTYKPAPVHLRPGYIPPPNQNEPNNQPPDHNRLPEQHDNFNPLPNRLDDQDFKDSLREGYMQSQENLKRFMGRDSDSNSNLESNKKERYGAAGFDSNDNFKMNDRIQDLNEAQPDIDEQPFENYGLVDEQAKRVNERNEDNVINRVQMIDKPGDEPANLHDFHAVKQMYDSNKAAKKQDRDLSQYAAAGRDALARQQNQRANQRPDNVNAANPFDKFMNQQSMEEDIRPHPNQWPVRILKQPDIGCLGGVELLILVHTHPSAFGTRRAIRNSWGTQTRQKYPKLGNELKWKTMFILGKDQTKQWEIEVNNEEHEFADILQGDFADNQYEGTRKFLLGISWLARNLEQGCEPMFVLKTEENIYHNMNSVIGWLEAKFENGANGVYMGKKLMKDLPIREPRDPYYVSWQEYPQTYFPDMIQGPEFLFDYETYKRLGHQIQYVNKIAMEEGYISLLADRANVKPTHNEHFILLEQTSSICHMLRMLFVSDVRPSEHRKIFRNTKEALTNGKCPNAHVIQAGNKRVNIEM